MIALQVYDILIEILLLLPAKSVFRFKAVSKVWNLWLSDPYFRDRFLLRFEPSASSSSSNLPVLGFFEICTMKYSDLKQIGYLSRPAFLPTSEQGRVMPKGHRRRGFYLGISNGLILCGYHPEKYYVCNPITNQCFPLPQPYNNNPSIEDSTSNVNVFLAISYDINDGSYIVFRADQSKLEHQNFMNILMYSSRTGQWDGEKCVVRSPDLFLIATTVPGIESGGIMLWWAHHLIAAYDHKKAKDKLWLIQSPYAPLHDEDYLYPICTMLPDGRLQCGVDDYFMLYIYVLKEKLHSYSYSNVVPIEEWEPKLAISYDEHGSNLFNGCIDSAEVHFRLVAFHPHNPNILYRRYGSAVYQFDVINTELMQAPGIYGYVGNAQIDQEAIILPSVVAMQPVSFSWTAPSYLFPMLLPHVHPIWPPSPSPSPSN
ncbi:hypothetical protein CCACVL1_13543 [Corchorus capsularis]|uniref:F-box domain-containing protein n=1 Tax=Corchorus capsularis TaxID=210143 RepID=A0A1R3IAM6_COCAP|nr:hypothetical protein CCACVL1_13543 [Corchorus capsularis]